MIPETGAAVAPRTPNARPTPALEVIVSPKPGKVFSHFCGYTVEGSKVLYQDVNAVMWYLSGWLTVNRGRKGLRCVHRGSEDSCDRQG